MLLQPYTTSLSKICRRALVFHTNQCKLRVSSSSHVKAYSTRNNANLHAEESNDQSAAPDETPAKGEDETDPSLVTERDHEVVKQQLKRKKIARPARVLRRCVYGYPQITFAFSRAGSPSKAKKSKTDGNDKAETPSTSGKASTDVQYAEQHLPGTLVWLTCPRVREMVSKWESRGGITKLREHFGLPTGRSDTHDMRKKLRTIVSESSADGKETDSTEAVTIAAVGLERGEEIPEKTRKLLQSHENYKAWLRDGDLLNREEYNKWRTSNTSTEDDTPDRRFGNAGVNVAASIKCAHAHMATYMIPGVEDYVGKETFEHLKEHILPEAEYQEGGRPPVDAMDDLHALDCRSCNVMCQKFDPELNK